ncbi:MAG: DUF1800 domain-containing protein [Opitutaceae bacterium]|nr:DUF1800 domain-containing protein [Opitutaceae bacterium]
MTPSATPPLPPEQAWQPLPSSAWDADAARHLLRRTGWAARPDDVARALRDGLPATLERLFPATPPTLARPAYLDLAAQRIQAIAPLKRDAPTPEERQVLDREQRDLERNGAVEFSLRWLEAAADPTRSAYEKWILFLSDLYVVSMEKVNRADWMYRHFDILRAQGNGPAPALTKAVSRSPAMISYLDLNRSSKRAPNENFARELFELFVLGEGNYTEDDIKQAARAFAGYRYGDRGFRFSERDADFGEKNIFGQSRKFTGDEVIDLAYAQPAAATFLPREMARFYLTDQTIPADFFAPLGEFWRLGGFELRDLCKRFFSSTIFFHPAYRANFIKSPVHYQLGLVQDLGLDVLPLPRTTLQPLRQMGQNLLYPPNVRGWVGGRLWINSSTLAARRQLAITLCSPFDEERLNADEKLELAVARDAGRSRFTVDEDRIRAFTSLGPEGVADRLCDFFLPVRVSDDYRRTLVDYLSRGPASDFEDRARRATIAILQSPEYQLC